MDSEYLISLDRPAASFTEGFPLGTGRIAGMIYGTMPEEKISLNHEWLWSARWRNRKDADHSAPFLPELRQLLHEGRYEEATKFGNDHFSPRGGISDKPARIDAYQSAGVFHVATDVGCSRYARELNMLDGVVQSCHGSPQTLLKREYVADLVSDMLYVRLSMEDASPFSGSCRLDRPRTPGDELEMAVTGPVITLSGQVPGGVRFMTQTKIFANGGNLYAEPYRIGFENVTELIAIIDIDVNTDGKKQFNCAAQGVSAPDWPVLLDEHRDAWQKLYRTCQIAVPNGGDVLRYFNYGRYLLLSASANAKLPPNLQGKWNEELNPPWKSDYHLNINLQMNFWGTDPTGLGWINRTLFDYLDRLAQSGRKVAEEMWGVKGLFLPHATDVWAQATPEAYGWSVWLGAAPWLAQHYMKYYRYTLDRSFLEKRAWPFLHDSAIFFEQLLQTNADGVLEIIPSQSPENQFRGGGAPVSLCISSACDVELLDELLRDAIFVAEQLDAAPKRRAAWQAMRDRLPKLQIGSDGRLLEWEREREELEPGHRHISHLIGLYPGSVITRTGTPALFDAARKSLEYRLAHAGGHTGWSRAWTANFFAVFGDGDRVLCELKHLAQKQSSISLLDLHPPCIFQIDGNLGAVAAVAAMLLQTVDGVLHLLPALPAEWPDGDAYGLCAENALTVNLSWRSGKLTRAVIHAASPVTCRMAWNPECFKLEIPFTYSDGITTLSLQAGESATIER